MPEAVALVLVGEELLDGRVRDAHGWFFAREIAALGGELRSAHVVGDRIEDIRRAMGDAAAPGVGVVLVSGGLGPTPDDLTREALAAHLGVELREDPTVVEGLQRRYAERGREMPGDNRRQALVPRGAEVLPNPRGTAPGLWLDHSGVSWVLLPGVPPELHGLWEDPLRERLRDRVAGAWAASRKLRVTGVAESTLSERVREALGEAPGVEPLFCVAQFGIDILLRGPDAAAVERATTTLREALGRELYGEGGEELPAVVLQALREREEDLAVAESCTGGLLGEALTAVPGSSDVFAGGVISYSNRLKQELLGVPPGVLDEHGAVSEPVAVAMARGARERLGVSWALATTGVAGPGGGTPDKPVGTVWVAVAGPGGRREARLLRLGGSRDMVRRWTVAGALELLRRELGRA